MEKQQLYTELLNDINDTIQEMKAEGFSAKEVTDGYHTFNELYYHRMVLSSIIFNMHKDVAFKSWQHDDGTMFDGSFIVGVKTPEGYYSYHYKAKFWDLFDVPEMEFAPLYDGHKPEDIGRLLSL